MSLIEPTNWLTTKIVNFIARHTPVCHDITRLLSQSMDGKLSLRQRFSIRFHFLICEWCERYGQQLKLLRNVTGAFHEHLEDSSSDKLPDDVKERLKGKLKGESNRL